MTKVEPGTIRILFNWRVACLLTLAASVLVYLPSMSGLAIWDDHALIGGPGIGGGKSLSACFTEPFLLHYFRPLVSVTFFLDHRAFGTGPFFYHQTNLLIHLLTTMACIGLLLAAFRSRVAAIAGALAFALQPAQVSTVAWIGGRTDSLCTLWVTLFAWSLVSSTVAEGKLRVRWTVAGCLFFGLALLTKEQALGLLPVVPLAFRCFSGRSPRAAWSEGIRWTLPYAVTGVLFVAAWLTVYPSPHRPVMHSPAEQAALAGRSMAYYAGLLAMPTPASMHMLSVGTLERWGVWSVLLGFAAAAALATIGIRCMKSTPSAAWFIAFLLFAILPISNVVPLPSLVVAPYRAGVAGLGAAALLGLAFATLAGRMATACDRKAAGDGAGPEAAVTRESALTRHVLGWAPALAPAALILWGGALTYWGAGQWQDERAIFSTIVRYDPDSIVARFNLTTALLKEHMTRPALSELNGLMNRLFGSRAWENRDDALAALRARPAILDRIRENQGNAIQPESWLAALYAQRGCAQLNLQNRAAARQSFAIGMAIDRANDDVNMGLAQMAYDRRDYRRARGFLRVVLAARPRRAEAHMMLGHTFAAAGDWPHARAELETWADLQPWSGQAQMEVAQARCRLGDYAGARASLEYALSHSICDVTEVRARLNDLRGRASAFLN